MDFEKLFKRIGIAAIILLLFGLGGWYLFLRGQSSDLEQLRSERGFDVGIPSFTGSRGSTFSNIEGGRIGTEDAVDFTFDARANDDTSTGGEARARPPRLWRTSAIPVAGAAFVDIASSTRLRYVERSTGHVFDVDVATGKIERRTNTLRPQTYTALITRDGDVLAQTVENGTRVTFAGHLGEIGADGFATFNGKTLPPNLLALAAFPTTNDIVYIVRGTTAAVIRSSYDGSVPTQIASLGTGSWNIFTLNDRGVLLSEKAASGITGSAYRVVNSLLVPIVRSIPGLQIMPHPNGEALLYSSDTGSDISTYLRPTRTATPTALSIKTVAEKCVWGPGTSLSAYCGVPRTVPRSFLDQWYRGLSHTEDTIWKIEGGGGSATEVFTPQAGVAMDVERMLIDDTGEYLAFINGIDKSLWVLRLKE